MTIHKTVTITGNGRTRLFETLSPVSFVAFENGGGMIDIRGPVAYTDYLTPRRIFPDAVFPVHRGEAVDVVTV